MLVTPVGVSSIAARRGTSGSLKKSASDTQVVPLEQIEAIRSSVPAILGSSNQGFSEPTTRRNSDGDISITEFSTDDGAEPGSPNAFGAVDWSETASTTSHIFVPTSSSIESCYLAGECLHSGHRVKCVTCRVISHEGCISTLNDRFPCKETFRECVRKYREQTSIQHHWVERRQLKGKCNCCGKTCQSKLGSKFNSASVVSVNCSWCKVSYHNHEHCREARRADEHCDLGMHKKVIVPPSWIIKLPRKGSFKSSLKNSPKKCAAGISLVTSATKKQPQVRGKTQRDQPSFLLKPIPTPTCCPVIVFLNPKSGGNQGAKLMQKFQWWLNPRQVFDLSQGGPEPALDLYRRVPGIRLLACGGDGTVGWLLSALDNLKLDHCPPVGVLPLGTGNDLSRSIGWGGGYTDEPISKIILALQSAEVIDLDRWKLKFSLNTGYKPNEKGVDKLPLEVVNNYFSLGVDAQIALQFHEAREANPHKFNSRIRNKMFYTQAGGKDLILRKWRQLTDHITVHCDGKDITPKLKELKVHSVVFSNIPSYSSGTRPWNRQCGEQKLDDGFIEVIGLTTYQLPLIQAGGHGHCITQCRTARIITRKTIPMQVDGEAVRVNPATIELSLLNQAKLLAKRKSGSKVSSEGLSPSLMKVGVSRISMKDYELFYCDKEKLKELAKSFGEIKVDNFADLEVVRKHVATIQEAHQPRLVPDWCFLDCVTAERFFRIDQGQESIHFLLDICEDRIFILEMEHEDIEELQNNLTITPLLGEDMTPPRSPLTPSPSPFDTEVENGTIENEKLRPMKPLRPTETQTVPTIGVAAPEGTTLKTTDGILKAARLGDLKMLTELFGEGYSLLSMDETGKTGLHYGARFGHKDIIQFFLLNSDQAIMDCKDNEKGQTALHKAAAYKRRTICSMLINAGASLAITDHLGQSPRQLALTAEDHELCAFLESQEDFQTNSTQDNYIKDDFETAV